MQHPITGLLTLLLLFNLPVALAGDVVFADFSSDVGVQKQLLMVAQKISDRDNKVYHENKALPDNKTHLDNTMNAGPPVIYTVGADLSCDYATIQSAINVTNSTQDFEIRVAANKTYTENLTVNRQNLKLVGGFDNCADALSNTGNNGYTSIEGDSAALPVLVLTNTNPGVQYYNDIANFDISLGTGQVSSPSGGINIMGNRVDAQLSNLLVHDNVGVDGGGLYVEGAISTVYANDVLIVLNEAENGGGVYCDDASIIMYGDSGVSFNTANGTFTDGSGGGLYATNACAFDMFSGTTGGFFDFRGFAVNKAWRSGGGLYVDQASIVNLWGNLVIGDYGNFDQPININANEASLGSQAGSGGGVFAADAGTQVNAYATIIKDNIVHESTSINPANGGAMYLGSGTQFSQSRLNLPCWDELKCNQISGNTLNGTNTQAAGIYAIVADVSVKNTWISGHQATGTAAFMFAQFSDVYFEGNTFVGNGGDSADGNQNLFSFFNGDNTLAFNTFAQNELNNSYIRVEQDQPLKVLASIFQDDTQTPILSHVGPTFSGATFDCVMAHEIQSFSDFESRSMVADPMFVDAPNQDFHLQAASPAIDYCDNTQISATTKDMDNESRNRDMLLVDDLYGQYDLGVDEVYPATNADISVDVTLSESPPFHKNQLIHYTVTLSNLGPDVATHIQVSEQRQRLQIVDVQPACESLNCEIDMLAANGGQVYQVTAKITQSGSFDLAVSVISNDFDPVSTNNTDDTGNGGVAVEEFADLGVSMELLTPPPYHSGQIVTYQAIVENLGPDVAKNVVFDNFFQTTTNMTTVSVQNSNCSALPCERASLPVNGTDQFIIEAQIVAGQSFNYSVDVKSDATDSNLSNNRSENLSEVANPTGDLAIATTLQPAANYEAGQTVTFDVVYSNSGPSKVGLVRVDALANNLTITSVTGGECTVFLCQPSTLFMGGSRMVTVTAVIIADGVFGLTNTITSGNYYDPDLTNNQSSASAAAGSYMDVIFSDGFE